MHETLYQINSRVMVRQLGAQKSRPGTLDDISDQFLDKLQAEGFDWVWLLGVWRTGEIGRNISRSNPEWLHEYRTVLPDVQERDICGSCFAVTGYQVDEGLGGAPALQRIRKRLADRSMKLLLDFVPNHTARDHPWVTAHPEYYVHGTEHDLASAPQNYCRVDNAGQSQVLAYGRDPYFAGWPDTLQLNYGAPELQRAMTHELMAISRICDGVRCDMAMLILPDVFQRTWGIPIEPFWQKAIQCTRQAHPGFIFMAEVYWDLEWTLQQLGFDFTYDKRLYDRLVEREAHKVRSHLLADSEFQRKSVRFLENHDEPRAARVFDEPAHQAAAVITFLVPGMRFFHQGQFEGLRNRLPVHLSRRSEEETNHHLTAFYERLSAVVGLDVTRSGDWRLLGCKSAWDGNPSNESFVCFSWSKDGKQLFVVVNYAPHYSQGYVEFPFGEAAGRTVELRDLLGPSVYSRSGDDLLTKGMYFDVPAWHYHVFDVSYGA